MDKHEIKETIEKALCVINDPYIFEGTDEIVEKQYKSIIHALLAWQDLISASRIEGMNPKILNDNMEYVHMDYKRYIEWLNLNILTIFNLLPGFTIEGDENNIDMYANIDYIKIDSYLKLTQVTIARLKESFNLTYENLLKTVLEYFIIPSIPHLVNLLTDNQSDLIKLKRGPNLLIKKILQDKIYTLII